MKMKRIIFRPGCCCRYCCSLPPPAARTMPSAGGKGTRRPGSMQMQFPVETVRVQDRAVTYYAERRGLGRGLRKGPGHGARGRRGREGAVHRRQPRRRRPGAGRDRAAALHAGRGVGAGRVHNKAAAAKSDAEAGLKRRETVDKQNPGLIPGEEIEAWRTKVLVAAAEMAQSRGRAQPGPAQPARRVRAGPGRPASCRRAPCRPASTSSPGRCWPRWCAATRCCCASRRPKAMPPACSPA